MSAILSLDPGGTTGVALLEVTDDDVEVLWTKQVEGGLHGFIKFNGLELAKLKFDVIICESFTLREGIFGADLSPVGIIGALEALYPQFGITYQEPKLKPLCDNERLKRLGLYIPGKPHAMDALRHAIIYLRNNKNKLILERGWR